MGICNRPSGRKRFERNDMLTLRQVKIPLSFFAEDEKDGIKSFIADAIPCNVRDIKDIRILKKSVDARKKPDIYFNYTLSVAFAAENAILRKHPKKHILIERPKETVYTLPAHAAPGKKERPLIIGDGPAGLFAAYLLAVLGFCPVVFERGAAVEERIQAVDNFFATGKLSDRTNVCYGEGGAGTFSDGKLNTLTKDRFGRQQFVLETFYKYGADENILYDAKPHIGTDRLREVLPRMRKAIEEMGGEFHFNTRVTDFLTTAGEDGRPVLAGIRTESGKEYYSHEAVLAMGHSARDTVRTLNGMGVSMRSKEFAVGVRIEHPQEWLDRAQFELTHPLLPRGDYKLAGKAASGRGVWTFCMCPGGTVVNSSSEDGRLSVNGMSNRLRDGKNCNSAVIVHVGAEDFSLTDPLAAIAFQEGLEEKAFSLCKGTIPQQLFADFRNGRMSSSYGAFSSETGGLRDFGRVDAIFPPELKNAITDGIEEFGRKIKGFDREDAILSGVESRTSSPVRIDREEDYQSPSMKGLYPCGEGAGFAGGIMSAAVDGIRCAERVAQELVESSGF